jgi:predicted XRE-type DNA-binding protein
MSDEIKHIDADDLFSALGFDKDQSAEMNAKARLYAMFRRRVQEKNLSRRELEKTLDEPQPRVSDLMTGKLDKFSMEKMILYFACLGVRVEFSLHEERRGA